MNNKQRKRQKRCEEDRHNAETNNEFHSNSTEPILASKKAGCMGKQLTLAIQVEHLNSGLKYVNVHQ